MQPQIGNAINDSWLRFNMIIQYIMFERTFIFLVILCFSCFSCTGRQTFGEENPELNVKRFDVDFYQYLNNQSTSEMLSTQYKMFLDVFGTQVIGIGTTDSTGFHDRLNSFFSEPTLMSLYKAEQEKFADFDFVNRELNPALTALLKEFPEIKQPSLYVHVSGLNQNIIVTDEILSLSADKYLGADYPLYQDFFYDYQRQNMTPERIVPDYLFGFMMANFPFEGNSEILLDNMIYEGKLRYILSCLLPERNIWEYVGYTKEQYSWSNDNEADIWKTILRKDHLYSQNYHVVTQYINEAPYTVPVSSSSPGRLGVWVGFRIVSAYMKIHPKTTLAELIKQVDAKQILKDSKYKP